MTMPVRCCRATKCEQKDKDGNCSIPGSDGLAVQCVGPWVEDKYHFLESYLNASRKAREKFSIKGNAVFIDLFSGPGKCIIEEKQKEIDSGGFRALHREEAPFNESFLFDFSKINVAALKKRIGQRQDCHVKEGDSNFLIKELTIELLRKPYRYHFTYVDPFGPDGLRFDTLAELAKLERMDMLIHFPLGPIRRNVSGWLDQDNTILDRFLGTNGWKERINSNQGDNIGKILIDIFKRQLCSIGYPEEGLKLASSDESFDPGLPTVSVKNRKNVDLYLLILAAKHPLAQEIWNSVIQIDRHGQKRLF
ncbi:MAG: three-Cys-motif partner protein TcmP [Nitrospinae bacterium]|nr:three-Cys-motif partner protein TcmP [Nitrospinota bacterium]